MNYPIWELTTLGGGTLIAVISIIHVYISHLAVGGGLFIWLTDLKGFRENNPQIHEYVKKHTWFFLLLTMVLGGVTGVGIWFIIALVNPAATSTLIHNFVFGWAIEWVFFVGEIVALLIYHYKFDQLSRKHRLQIAFFYFLFAWLSLVVINGILSFMLTPGAWLETKGFWDGFFNPGYFQSLIARTFIAIMIAGLFGLITAVYQKDTDFRSLMMRYSAKWVVFPVIGIVVFSYLYYLSVPDVNVVANFLLNPQTGLFVNLIVASTILVALLGMFFFVRSNVSIQKFMIFVIILIGFLWMGSFEYIREIARKPYIISNFMFSTSIKTEDVDKLNKDGVLAHAKWSSIKEITDENIFAAGKEVFNLECLSCHTADGIRNDIIPRSDRFSYMGVLSLLTGQGRVQTYMPEFIGTDEEKEALAKYVAKDLNNKKIIDGTSEYDIKQIESDVPAYDKKKDEYILLAWNDLGMHCMSDSDPWFAILPPANTLEAQLIKRGDVPQIITEGVEIRYRPEQGFENPSKYVDFWKYVKSNFNAELQTNVGLFEFGISGKMKVNEKSAGFIAQAIPVVPYHDNGYNPYPYFVVEAVNVETGEVLVSTKVVAPVSTEMGCKNCHDGDWKNPKIGAGIADQTARNILIAHDELSGTDLYEKALNGEPQLCQSCHADPALGTEGVEGINNFSASMHGWHANYMFEEGADACRMCHPATQKGSTRCNRGIHSRLYMDCTNCHGTLDEHAISLLKDQTQNPSTGRLMKNLVTENVDSKDEVNPRQPWVNEPDCLTCHQDFEAPDYPMAFNVWNESFDDLYRIRTDNAGVRCIACHNSTHAEYPAVNPYSVNRDNVQPIQYSGMNLPIGSDMSCETCHLQKMEFSIHHENMLRKFRNTDAVPEI